MKALPTLMRRYMWAARTVFVLVLVLLATNANASKPRPIDCAKAEAIRLGWTQKQVVKALGKPYSMEFVREYMTFGWEASDGNDRLRVRFENSTKNIEERRVAAVAGSCGGSLIMHLLNGEQAANSLRELDQHPYGKELPRRLSFEGTDFLLAYVMNDRERGVRLAEYIPQGQSLVHWRKMLSVYLHTDGSTPLQKLEEMEAVAKRTGNPHFKQLYAAADGSEAIAALPMLREDAVEYQVARWLSVPGGVQASVYFVRTYKDEGIGPDAFAAQEAERARAHAEALKGLSKIVPPDLGKPGWLIFTGNGKEDGEVWSDPHFRSSDQ